MSERQEMPSRGWRLVKHLAALQWAELRQRTGAALRQRQARPERLRLLDQGILRDRKAPFASSAAVADIQRFLLDPAGYRSEADPVPADGLAGAHLRHALVAQARAFRNAAAGAAAAMGDALLALPAAPPGDQAAARHRMLLAALAISFRCGHAQAAGVTINEAAWQSQPMLGYLHRQWAEQRRAQGDLDEALAAFERALAVAPPDDVAACADIAIDAAVTALELQGRAGPDAAEMLSRIESRFLARAAAALLSHWDEVEEQWHGSVTFWRGRVALAEASLPDRPPEPGLKAAARAIAHFEEVGDRDNPAATKDAAASWLPDARRQWALHALRLGDAEPAATALRHAGAPGSAPCAPGAAGAGPYAIDWRGIAGGFTHPSSPLATELAVAAERCLTETRAAMRPISVRQRLVFEVSDRFILIDEEARRLIGEQDAGASGDARPSIAALRLILRHRFGLELPGILVRSVPDGVADAPNGDALAVTLLENVPIGDVIPIALGKRFRFTMPAESWLLARRPEGDGGAADQDSLNPSEYAAWSIGQAVLGAMPELLGVADAQELLPGLPPAKTLPLLRLLLADRTPLLERDALQDLAAGVVAGRLTELSAAAAFRALPAVRETLWGVEGQWEDFELSSDLELDLASELPPDQVAGTIPEALRNRLVEAVARILLPPTDSSNPSAQGARPDAPLLPGAPQHDVGPQAPLRVIVQNARLRPWVAAMLRHRLPERDGRRARLQDVPVLSATELGR